MIKGVDGQTRQQIFFLKREISINLVYHLITPQKVLTQNKS